MIEQQKIEIIADIIEFLLAKNESLDMLQNSAKIFSSTLPIQVQDEKAKRAIIESDHPFLTEHAKRSSTSAESDFTPKVLLSQGLKPLAI